MSDLYRLVCGDPDMHGAECFELVTIDRRAAQVAVAEGILDRIAGGDDWEDWADEALALVDICVAAAIGARELAEEI